MDDWPRSQLRLLGMMSSQSRALSTVKMSKRFREAVRCELNSLDKYVVSSNKSVEASMSTVNGFCYCLATGSMQ